MISAEVKKSPENVLNLNDIQYLIAYFTSTIGFVTWPHKGGQVTKAIILVKI